LVISDAILFHKSGLTQIFLISRAVKVEIGDEFQLRALGDITVKGKSEPIQVFAVDGYTEQKKVEVRL